MQWTFLPALVLVAGAGSAHAVQYLTLEQAQAALFPAAASFKPMSLLLTDAQREAVGRQSDTRVRDAHVRAWFALDAHGAPLGRFILDEVTGKHDLITYALAVAADGRVAGLEVLDYRESYGGQIREAGWRAQFRGKTPRDPLKLDADIANVSGATLSCAHVTDGVRRLLALDELVLRKLAA